MRQAARLHRRAINAGANERIAVQLTPEGEWALAVCAHLNAF